MDYRRGRMPGKIDALAQEPYPPTTSSLINMWWANNLNYNNSDPVENWADLIESKTVTAVGGARPTFNSTGMNNNPTVDFNGTANYLSLGQALSTSTQGCIVAVAKLNESPNTKAMWTQCADNSDLRYFIARMGYPTANRLGSQYCNGGTEQIRRMDTALNTNAAVYEWESDDSAITLRLNNAANSSTQTTGSNTGAWLGDITAPNEFVIGAERFYYLSTLYTQGFLAFRLAMLAVYDTPLNSGDRATLYNWISNNYGITMS